MNPLSGGLLGLLPGLMGGGGNGGGKFGMSDLATSMLPGLALMQGKADKNLFLSPLMGMMGGMMQGQGGTLQSPMQGMPNQFQNLGPEQWNKLLSMWQQQR